MGAVRLAIIDVAGGDQPMQARSTSIVFNGEIYNHAEMRDELDAARAPVSIRAATPKWCCAPSWSGTSSASPGSAACSRWPSGTSPSSAWCWPATAWGSSPCTSMRRGRDLHFGSELKTHLRPPEVERRISLSGLNLFFSLNYIPGPHTLVEGIEKLPPAHWLEWQQGEDPDRPLLVLRVRPAAPDASSRRRKNSTSLMRASVREHLISDVPLGVWAIGRTRLLGHPALRRPGSAARSRRSPSRSPAASTTRAASSARSRRSTGPTTTSST